MAYTARRGASDERRADKGRCTRSPIIILCLGGGDPNHHHHCTTLHTPPRARVHRPRTAAPPNPSCETRSLTPHGHLRPRPGENASARLLQASCPPARSRGDVRCAVCMGMTIDDSARVQHSSVASSMPWCVMTRTEGVESRSVTHSSAPEQEPTFMPGS